MKLELLTPQRWQQNRKKLLAFAVKHSDNRLTLTALRTLHDLEHTELQNENASTAIAVITINGAVKGLGFAAEGGERGCLFVVHEEARGKGIGTMLAEALYNKLGRLACNVAADNAASMAVCFRIGMKAVSMHIGPTGKPTLRFERGICHDKAGTRHFDTIFE